MARELKTQPSKKPTRKIWAVILASALVAIIKVLIETFVPGIASNELFDSLEMPIYGLIISIAGYMTRDVKEDE